MEKVCPVCNKINDIKYKCKNCGSEMVDKGRKQEYFNDYSADDPIYDIGDYCLHLFKCSKCDFMEDTLVRKVIM
ncbi:MAG: hypothetical protein E7216_10510 [Clostridium thermopalmarium]|uniref:hypothetical protein n=1 Tax=Clostridium thermopalmarium TaxID=29373 RepID=UPI002354E6DE|nr:hypothetical protein [Clostridium thermopalmarium]MBE6044644.1 hypothetical protein [Clostridium thermopalmarium]